jgi:hypothetical protein
MIGSETERRNFGLQLGHQLPSRIGGRLEQFSDQAVSPIALAFVVFSVTGCGRFEVGQLRLQRLDAFLECGDLSGDKRPGGLKGAFQALAQGGIGQCLNLARLRTLQERPYFRATNCYHPLKVRGFV